METDAAAAGDEADIGHVEAFFMDFQQSSRVHYYLCFGLNYVNVYIF